MKVWCGIISDGYTYYKAWWGHDTCHMVVTQSCNIKKNEEDSKTDNIIQYNNNMLAL